MLCIKEWEMLSLAVGGVEWKLFSAGVSFTPSRPPLTPTFPAILQLQPTRWRMKVATRSLGLTRSKWRLRKSRASSAPMVDCY